MKNLHLPLTFLLTVSALPALQSKPSLDCNSDHEGGNRAHYCEMREHSAPASGMISVDASQNGGISIKGWDRADVLVRAQVRTYAPTDGEAKVLASQINVQTSGPDIRAYGPAGDREHSWSVNYEVFVPSHFSGKLETVNGGVSISDVSGDLEFKTVNGGLSLQRVGGYVHGHTTNGGVSVVLAGDRWEGQGMDVTTTNGGVTLRVPHNYSAQLEARTNNGHIRAADLPEVQANHISTPLGSGGAVLKVTTTNGGVSVARI